MKKIALFLFLSTFCLNFSYSQTNPTPKKEIKISIDSTFYKSAAGVLIGYFKQAKIANYYIDSKLQEKMPLNFQFRDLSTNQAEEVLKKIYKIKFEKVDKDFYFVSLEENK